MARIVADKNYVYPAKPVYIAPDSGLFKRLNNDSDYVAELKKNGWRCMVRVKEDHTVELWTRNKTIIDDPLPNVRKRLFDMKLPPDTILDGELMEHRGKVREQWNAFGAIRVAGKWLSHLPYSDITKIVSDVVKTDKRYIVAARQVKKNKKRLYAKVEKSFYSFLEEGVQSIDEGIVIKSLTSPVPFGWRECPKHPSWFKVKPLLLCDGNAR
jgi:ATP-dependent DNA ligase